MFNPIKSLNSILTNVAVNLPLRTVLIVPFVLQIVGTVGLVGYLSYKNGQRAVENIAYQLIDEVDKRVEQNVYHYLEIPHQVTQNLAAAIRTGVVDWKNFSGLERYFAQQLQIYTTVSTVAIATEEREFLAVAKSLASDSLIIRVLDQSTNYAFHYYTANLQGQRIKRTQVRYDFDPHNDPPQGEAWYPATKQAGKGIWRPVVNLSQGVDKPLLMIANFLQFNDSEGNFQGVLAATFFVPELAEFLEGVEVGKTGQVFIINQKGEFVASSTGEIPFKPDLKADYRKNLNPQDWRLPIQQSKNPLTKASVSFLLNQVKQWSTIKQAQNFKFTFKHNRYFLQVNPIQDQSGLNWLIVTVVPESDFMAEIHANTRTTIGLCVAALILSIIMGIRTARWVTKPILQLNKAADAIARGEWQQSIAINRGDEVGQLAASFQTMAAQLQQYFTQLKSSNQALTQSESRLTQILEAIPVGISVHDINGQLTYANEKSKELLGIETLPDAKIEELAATYQVYQSESNQLYPVGNLPVVRALNGQKTIVEDMEIHQPDHIVPLEVYGTPLLDQTGTIIGAIAAFADITERKRAETLRRNYNRTLEANVAQRTAELVEANERLQQEMAGRQLLEGKLHSSEQQIRTIFEAINDIVLIIDHQKSVQVAPTKRTYLSPEDSNLLNVIIEQFFEDAQDRWFAQVQQVLETGQTIYFDYNLTWDNRQIWFTISIAPLSDQSVIWVARDISDRKLAEDALRTSEYLYRAMARNFPNGAIFLFDPNLRYLVADGQALAQAGYSWEALHGKTLWEVLSPATCVMVEPLYHAALAGIEQTQEISIGGLTYLCQSTAVRNDAGNVIAGMVVTQDITERKQFEQALIRSENRFQEIASTVSQFFFVRSASSGKFLYVSPAYETIWGRSCESLYQNPESWIEAVHPEDRASVLDSLSQQFQGHPVQRDYRIIRADGEQRWITGDISVVRDEAGEAVRFVGLVEDITERKQAEIELQSTKERLQYLLTASPAVIFSCQATGDFSATFMSENVSTILGYDAENFIHNAPFWWVRVHPEDKMATTESLPQLFAQGYCTYEYRFHHSDGTYHWFATQLTLVRDEMGTPLECVGYLVDITERKQAEESLRERETFLRSIYEGIEAAVFIVDVLETGEFRYVSINPAHERMSGLCSSEIQGKTPQEILAPDIAEAVCQRYHRCLTAGERITYEHSLQINGKDSWWISNLTPLKDRNSRIYRLIGTSLNISDRKQVELQFKENQRFIEKIINTSPQLLYLFEPTAGTDLYINQQSLDILGYTPEEIICRGMEFFLDVLHPDDLPLIERNLNFWQTASDSDILSTESRFRHKDGSWRWLLSREVVFERDETNRVIKILGTSQDITELKEAEDALRRYERIVSSTTDAISLLDMNYTYQIVNQAYLDWNQKGYDEIVGHSVSDLLGEEVFEQVIKPNLDRCLAGETVTYQEWFDYPGEKHEFISVTYIPYLDGNQQISGVIVNCRNLTELKQVETQLRQTNQEMQAIFDAFPDILFRLAADGTILDFRTKNSEFSTSAELCLNHNIQEVLPTSAGAKLYGAIQQVLATGSLVSVEYSLPFNQGEQYFEARMVPLNHNEVIALTRNISDRKQAEFALAASQSRFAGILEIANDAIISVDAQQRITLFNQGAEKMFGYKAEHVLGQPLDLLLPPCAATIHRQHVTNFAESVGTARQMGERNELFGRRYDGTEFPTEASISKLEINGEILCTAILRDISDRKAAELQLSQQKEILQTIFDYLPIMLCFYKDGIDVHFVNPAFEQTLGWSLEELRDRDIMAEAYPDPDYRASVLEFMQKADGNWQDFQVTTRTGEILETTWANIRLPDGSTVGIGQDITERKQAELALQEREYRLRTLADNLPNGLIYQLVREPNGKFHFSYITAGIERLVGIKPEEIIQDASVLFNLIVDEDRQLNYQRNEESWRNLSLYEMQMRKRTIRGDIRWSYVRSAPRRLADGRTVWDGIEIDITDLKKTEIELAKAKDAAEAANRAKSAFLASMSHELRTPLNGILGYAQILKPHSNLTQKQKDGIEIIYQCGQHLLTLINDILDLSKVEAGKLELYPEEFHFPSFIVGLCEIFRLKATQKDITFIYHAPTPMPQVIYGDEKRLRQVLMNLLSNAVKFTDKGSVTFTVILEIITTQDYGIEPKFTQGGLSHIRASQETIEVTPTPTDSTMAGFEQRLSSTDPQDRLNPPRHTQKLQKIRFQIEDTGIGMSSEDLEKIFLPFEQIKDSSRRHEGTGLGLAITHKLVALMGSKIEVESTLGVGSKFWFEVDLPAVPASAEFIPAKPMDMIVGYSGAKRKILIVDDRWENCAVLKSILEPLRFEVQDATNGREGLEKALEWQPDLILVDIVMPVMDGHQMTQQLRQLSEFINTPIIAISANAFANNRVESLDAGCTDFLTKPIATTDLLQKIQVYLNVSWVYQAKAEQSKPSCESGNMVIPSQEELVALYEAASMGDVAGVEQETMGLQDMNPDYIPFALEVLEMAANFDYEKIVDLLDNCFEDW
ncbi:PAS domain S-box protein [Coleofasciculus sp. G2-EDA-02]|uniref:PAS domain S-box protein n=1 Tax=Coleofasciculus sp. G2-EDA-02 TaxID=3069529 RepID=UPI0032F41390